MIVNIENNIGADNYRIPAGTEVIFIRGKKNCNTHPSYISSGVIIEDETPNVVKEHSTGKRFLPYDNQIII